MKLSLLLLLTSGASAQVSIYTQVANSIDLQVNALNSLVNAYTGGAAAGSSILRQASSVQNAINLGAVSIGSATLTTCSQISTMAPYFNHLAVDYQTLCSNIIARSKVFVANGLCSSIASIAVQERIAVIGVDRTFSTVSSHVGPDCTLPLNPHSGFTSIIASLASVTAVYAQCT